MIHIPSRNGDYQYLYKLLLIGNSGVGKSCLLTRFADSAFVESQTSTIGVDFRVRTVEFDDKRIKLQVWDSAGQERFRTVSEAYYRGAHGIGIVFDITDSKTFSSVESSWLAEVMRNNCSDVPRLLIGNKSDLSDSREVAKEYAESFANEYGMQYIETSAKTAENVTKAFNQIAREIYESRGSRELALSAIDSNDAIRMREVDEVQKEKNQCC